MNKRDQYLFILHKFVDKEAEINYPKQFKMAKTLVGKYGFYFFIVVDLDFKPDCLSFFISQKGQDTLFKRFKYIALSINKSKRSKVGDKKIGKDRKFEKRNRKPAFLKHKKY